METQKKAKLKTKGSTFIHDQAEQETMSSCQEQLINFCQKVTKNKNAQK